MSSGILHNIDYNVKAFEFSPSFGNVVLFVGGLTNGLLDVPYLPKLSAELSKIKYTLIQAQLTSCHKGFGTSSLANDVKELSAIIKHLKTGANIKNIILAGHSTGCQDVMEYLTNNPNLKENEELYGVLGGILQAPVSDRGALSLNHTPEEIDKFIEEVHEIMKQNNNNPDTLLSNKYCDVWFNTPMTAYRFLSLSEKSGDDDYFSADLSDEDLREKFGKIDRPLLILPSGSDEYVPKKYDQGDFTKRWESFIDSRYHSKYSGVVVGAKHDINLKNSDNYNVQNDYCERVIGFIKEHFLQ